MLPGATTSRPMIRVHTRATIGSAAIAGQWPPCHKIRPACLRPVDNPFRDYSYDRSFKFPKANGQELMRYAALWIEALDMDGAAGASGGPLLESRPTLAAADTVRQL